MEFLDKLSEILSQAYVYIPAILSFISAIGFPSMVQIAKIFSSAKLYVTQIAKVFKKMNETVDVVNNLTDFIISTLDEDAQFFEAFAETTYNKNQRQACLDRAAAIRARKQLVFKKIEELKEEQSAKKKKVKVKVRIKPEEQNNAQ